MRQLGGIVLAFLPREDEEEARQLVLDVPDKVCMGGSLGLGRPVMGPSPDVPVLRDVPHFPDVLERGDAGFRIEPLPVQRDRAVLVPDDRDLVPLDCRDPFGELLRVRDGGRKAEEAHVLLREDDGFLPDIAALDVVDEVDFVEDHVAQRGEGRVPRDGHIAVDLRRHDDDGRPAVLGDVPGQQADVLLPVIGRELLVLLVGQRLDGGRVDDLLALLDVLADDVVRDERLARARRGGHDDALVLLYGPDGVFLEGIKNEVLVLHG